jgi:predicted GH43/DUF377 family glycosyl hydrolase
MPTRKLTVTRRPEVLLNDDKRVIPRYLDFGRPARIRGIFRRIMKIPESKVAGLLTEARQDFVGRHRDLEEAWKRSFREVASLMRTVPPMSDDRRLLVGAYFTMEYSIESAALFNPSIVPHPDQSGLGEGQVRFLMGLRATGEGHLSSIVFRRGVIDAETAITFDPPPRYAYTARPSADPQLSKDLFRRKLRDLGDYQKDAESLLRSLPEPFSLSQLSAALNRKLQRKSTPEHFRSVAAEMRWLAEANYSLGFPEDCHPSENVIFPATAHEQRGMEDLRLVQFTGDDGEGTYYGTYTAYDGRNTHPMLLETPDFVHFHVGTLAGRFVRNKGMALFPRKVDGYYCMLARHDGENNFLLRSHDLYQWNTSHKIQAPVDPWELVQVGNCGSPMETPEGWLVLTHGVGPMREYCIGAILLDLDEPEQVIGRLHEPLLAPTGDEREGYVPNVVYTCGAMIHGQQLIIPYAMSDARTAFATVDVDMLIAKLRAGR